MMQSSDVPRKRRRCVTIGSDCTGLNAAALAFATLGIAFEELFASDISRACRSVLETNFKIGMIYEDCKDVPAGSKPQVDFYSAGFPCVSWSLIGKKEGLQSEKGRVSYACLLYIAAKKPKTFLLENVAALVSDLHWKDFEYLMSVLKGIREPSVHGSLYHIQYKVMNSLDYGSVAQSRNRVYIIGIRRDCLKNPFLWPGARDRVPLEQFLYTKLPAMDISKLNKTEKTNLLQSLKVYVEKKKQGQTGLAIADLGHAPNLGPAVTYGHCPCLTKSRTEQDGYYVLNFARRPSMAEYMSLQGIDPKKLRQPDDVSDRQMRSMVGNSFTVTVVSRIIACLMWSVDLAPPSVLDGDGEEGHCWC